MEQEKKPKKKMKRFVIIFFAAVLIAAIAYCTYFFVILKNWEPSTSLKETNTNPVIYETITEMKEFLGRDYPCLLAMDQYLLGATDEEMNQLLLPVPGMEATKTGNSKGKLQMCTSMTPQGIVATDDGIFISAYCYTHKHNSVIYYISLEGELISTISLDSKSHVGGLAYDTVNKILWVSEKKNKKTALGGLNLSTIQAYSDKEGKTIVYDQLVELQGIKAASYITYYNGAVWVGLFNYSSKGKVMEFLISEDGKLDGTSDYTMETDENIQGISICDDYAIMSKSYGPWDSKILIFPIVDSENIIEDIVLGEESALLTVNSYPKLEQIGTYGNKMYFLYESAAFAYRQRGSDNIDRVLSYELRSIEEMEKLLLNNDQFSQYNEQYPTINEDVLNELIKIGYFS